ncbi:helix-turn-helix domain containing protein [Amycolatopsis cynarae]|uniref:Helix-turn-helix domain containing protein n=1 Tax=Amycolatopsis cynarae TaxID=2995223 RepID=A0ABY7AWD6_9PSEU|nr:helix-turn-helix domain-containing protein [Amycolatopsis sp. HUAS 11-8]WAL64320.1 helix-turn-helix domain containing protein [Amycolatopsis sp. HUAS 11-8]
MARPKVPLISRRKALETALRIIDEHGLEGLSIRRLAEALGVNGASLYHHFRNKDEILTGVAELALAEVRIGEPDGGDWRHWLPKNARALRRALLAHPALLPVVAGRPALGAGVRALDEAAARLMDEGVPSAAVMPLLDGLELFTIGSALHEIQRDGAGEPAEVADERYPALAKAMAERGLSADEVFDLVTASIVEGIDEAVKQRQERWMPPRKSSRDTSSRRHGGRRASGKS